MKSWLLLIPNPILKAIIILIVIGWIALLVKITRGPLKKLESLGYRNINLWLWEKDGTVFSIPSNNYKKATPIEIIELNEITRNTRLVQLEVRYRVNGAVKSTRISGSTNYLLEVEDKLGYLS